MFFSINFLYIVFNELLQSLFTDAKLRKSARVIVGAIIIVPPYFRAVFQGLEVVRLFRKPHDLGSVCSSSIHPHPYSFFFYVTEPHPDGGVLQNVFDESIKNEKRFFKKMCSKSDTRNEEKPNCKKKHLRKIKLGYFFGDRSFEFHRCKSKVRFVHNTENSIVMKPVSDCHDNLLEKS